MSLGASGARAGAAGAPRGCGVGGRGPWGLVEVAHGGFLAQLTLVSMHWATLHSPEGVADFPVLSPSTLPATCLCRGWVGTRAGVASHPPPSLPATSLQWWTTAVGCHAWGPSCCTRYEALPTAARPMPLPCPARPPGYLTVSSLLAPGRASRDG